MFIFIGGFGDTAGAVDGVLNPNPALEDPSVVLSDDQAVLQFKTTQSAASFYNQAYARFKQCNAFTETSDNLQVELVTQSLSSTTIGGHKAFQLIQHADYASFAGSDFYEVTAVVLAGTNVYTVDDVNGTNDPVSASLIGRLISRVQALYKH